MTDDTRLDARVRGALADLPMPDDHETRAALQTVLERSRGTTALGAAPTLVVAGRPGRNSCRDPGGSRHAARRRCSADRARPVTTSGIGPRRGLVASGQRCSRPDLERSLADDPGPGRCAHAPWSRCGDRVERRRVVRRHRRTGADRRVRQQRLQRDGCRRLHLVAALGDPDRGAGGRPVSRPGPPVCRDLATDPVTRTGGEGCRQYEHEDPSPGADCHGADPGRLHERPRSRATGGGLPAGLLSGRRRGPGGPGPHVRVRHNPRVGRDPHLRRDRRAAGAVRPGADPGDRDRSGHGSRVRRPRADRATNRTPCRHRRPPRHRALDPLAGLSGGRGDRGPGSRSRSGGPDRCGGRLSGATRGPGRRPVVVHPGGSRRRPLRRDDGPRRAPMGGDGTRDHGRGGPAGRPRSPGFRRSAGPRLHRRRRCRPRSRRRTGGGRHRPPLSSGPGLPPPVRRPGTPLGDRRKRDCGRRRW